MSSLSGESERTDFHPTAFDLETTAGEESDGLGNEYAFEGLNACGEDVGRVVIFHRNGFLEDDGAVVVLFIHEVHRGAGDLDAGFEHGLVDPAAVAAPAREGGDQGRVDVQGSTVEFSARLEGREEAEQDATRSIG